MPYTKIIKHLKNVMYLNIWTYDSQYVKHKNILVNLYALQYNRRKIFLKQIIFYLANKTIRSCKFMCPLSKLKNITEITYIIIEYFHLTQDLNQHS